LILLNLNLHVYFTLVVRYADEIGPGVSVCAFLGDECTTLKMTEDLECLHSQYYEPRASVAASLDALLRGPRVKKILFMATPDTVEKHLMPHWQKELGKLRGASILQAVPNMLELVPEGVNKWVGAQVLLHDLGVPRQNFMAVGDGGNDLEIVMNAGVGIAMGNAVHRVKAAADLVVSTNDEDGIAEAFERFVL
jgi:hydroxymethylpyrimidine pyrophosphatase-like HAD family hydrolase